MNPCSLSSCVRLLSLLLSLLLLLLCGTNYWNVWFADNLPFCDLKVQILRHIQYLKQKFQFYTHDGFHKASIFIFHRGNEPACAMMIDTISFHSLNQTCHAVKNLHPSVYNYISCMSFCSAGKPDVLHRKQPQQSSSERFLLVNLWEWTHYGTLWNTRVPG